MSSRGILIRAPYARLPALSRQVEAAGFDTAWVGESVQSATVQAAVVAGATSTIRIGTNITLALPRSPAVTAMEAWDLNEVADGRFIIGLGSQVRRIIEERFSAAFDHPAGRMGEYLQAMQAAWAMECGRPETFEGRHYRVMRPGLGGYGQGSEDRVPPAYLAAVGPRMTEIAARHADGWIGHPLTSDRYLTDVVLPQIAVALEGRQRSAFTICQNIICSVAETTELAVREAKHQIAFYGTTPNYKRVFAPYGDEHLTDQLRQVWRDTGQDIDALVDVIPDEVAHRYAVAGTPAEVADRLRQIEPHVDHVILGPPRYKIPDARIEEKTVAILEAFGSR
jgi:probable F420-dependent oxidoreductase